jgi:hypothetical protein
MMELAWRAGFDRNCPVCNRYLVGEANIFKSPEGAILTWDERQV